MRARQRVEHQPQNRPQPLRSRIEASQGHPADDICTFRRTPHVIENNLRQPAELPEELRWREWMGRVEAGIFASPTPVSRGALAGVVGPDCNLDLLIDDIRAELANRPYDLVAVAGGFQHRTRKRFAETICASVALGDGVRSLSQQELLVLAAIAYYQPISGGELGEFLGREVSRDLIGRRAHWT